MTHKSSDPNQKWCVQGQHFTDRSNFASNSSKSDGLQGSCRDCDSQRTTIFSRQKRTGWTQEAYDSAVVEQGGRCAVCGGDNGGRALCADHNHKTGQPRRLLCDNCNRAIGYMNDNPTIAERIASYLRR